MIVQDIDCPFSDWNSDRFARVPIRIRINLSGLRIGFRLTDQRNIICFRNIYIVETNFVFLVIFAAIDYQNPITENRVEKRYPSLR